MFRKLTESEREFLLRLWSRKKLPPSDLQNNNYSLLDGVQVAYLRLDGKPRPGYDAKGEFTLAIFLDRGIKRLGVTKRCAFDKETPERAEQIALTRAIRNTVQFVD